MWLAGFGAGHFLRKQCTTSASLSAFQCLAVPLTICQAHRSSVAASFGGSEGRALMARVLAAGQGGGRACWWRSRWWSTIWRGMLGWWRARGSLCWPSPWRTPMSCAPTPPLSPPSAPLSCWPALSPCMLTSAQSSPPGAVSDRSNQLRAECAVRSCIFAMPPACVNQVPKCIIPPHPEWTPQPPPDDHHTFLVLQHQPPLRAR